MIPRVGAIKRGRDSLSYLEDVLFAINNGEASTVVHETNVACCQPAILIHSVTSVFLVLVIALENNRATNLDLSSREWLVCTEIVHGRNIHKSDLASSARTANVSRDIFAKKGARTK